MTIDQIYYYMNLLAQSYEKGDYVPIGCVLIYKDNFIIKWNGPTIDHCELLAIKTGLNLGWDLRQCTIIVSCEPCSMCLTALCLVKIKTIIFGCYNKVFGALGGNFNLLNINQNLYKPYILGGFMEEYWSDLLEKFFKNLRN